MRGEWPGGDGSRRSRPIWSAALALSVALAAVAHPSFADAYDAAMANAIAAKEKAVDSNEPAHWQEAVRLFLEADVLRETKESKYELASAAAHVKEDDLAVDAFDAAIALGLGGKAKEKAEAFVKAHAAQMGRLMVTGPAGATVSVGARVRGHLPLARPLVVFGGKNHLVVRLGDKVSDQEIEAEVGKTVTKEIAFATTATASSASSTVPPPPPPPPVIVDDGGSARTLGWTLIVGGGVVTVAGIITTFVSNGQLSSHRDSLRNPAECAVVHDDGDNCDSATSASTKDAAQSDADAIATWKGVRIAGVIGIGVGALGVIGGVIRLATAKSASPTTGLVMPWVPQVAATPGGASLSWTGAF